AVMVNGRLSIASRLRVQGRVIVRVQQQLHTGAAMPISQKIRDLIYNAWTDGSPCLLATQGPDGPNISPKGSMLVYDDEHLAYWERSKRQALENLGHDRRVAVM